MKLNKIIILILVIFIKTGNVLSQDSIFNVNNIEINNSVDFTNFLLNEARVAVVPGIEFGLDKNIRISYATSIVDIREGVKRIGDVISKYW